MIAFVIFCAIYIVNCNGSSCLCDDCSECVEGTEHCIDLRQGPQHHHYMSLTSTDNAVVEGGADDTRSWSCTCSTGGGCNGLIGDWTCSGFYNGAIKIESQTQDLDTTFTTSLVNFDGSNQGGYTQICYNNPAGCDAVDIDQFLTVCSEQFANTNNNIDGLSQTVNDNTADISGNVANINKNTGDIGTNTADISDTTADINKNAGDISDNAAAIAILRDEMDGIQSLGAHSTSIIDTFNSKNNTILLILLISNVLTIIIGLFICWNGGLFSKKKHGKYLVVNNSDSEIEALRN